MPDKRTHRGPHPADEKLFAAGAISNLRTAAADFSLLLTRGYAEKKPVARALQYCCGWKKRRTT